MNARVICCGLATVDVQLHNCELPLHLEHITPFSHTTSTPGGSAPQTAKSLAALSISVTVLAPVGTDAYANTLTSLLEQNNIDTSCMIPDSSAPTALAILPLFNDGRRGCFVTLGANQTFTPEKALQPIIDNATLTNQLKVFHFGYPHLMDNFQGIDLSDQLLKPIKKCAPNVLITLDINGASISDDETQNKNPILIPSLPLISHLHANLEEACVVTGSYDPSNSHNLDASHVQLITNWFFVRGLATISITCGKHGAFLATSHDKSILLNAKLDTTYVPVNAFIHRSAFQANGQVNASGAGDSFVGGIIAQFISSNGGSCGVQKLLDSGLASALQTIDSTLVSKPTDINQVVEKALQRSRIPPRSSLLENYKSVEGIV